MSLNRIWVIFFGVLAVSVHFSFGKSSVSEPCLNGIRRSHKKLDYKRYDECIKGRWKEISCPIDYYFDPKKNSCVLGIKNRQKRAEVRGAEHIELLGKAIEKLKGPENVGPVVAQIWKKYLPAECGMSGKDWMKKQGEKIAHGQLTIIEENPWQVAIKDRGTGILACGGSIISRHHVLTAAHCFKGRNTTIDGNGVRTYKEYLIKKESKIISAGATNLKNFSNEFDILVVKIHEKHRLEHKRNDIALIRIVGTFHFTESIFPICLPINGRYQNVYQNDPKPVCKISGWGKTSSESKNNEENLRMQYVSIVGVNDCKRNNSLESNVTITKGMFCAGDYKNGKSDTCQGDSGGPLVCREGQKEILFGITSWGVGCGKPNFPGVYVKVATYMDEWLVKHLEDTMSDVPGDKTMVHSEPDIDIEAEDNSNENN